MVHFAVTPALVVALAMGAGIIAQVVARHLSVPGIVLLLATGVALGPDGANLVRPALLGDALHILVGFAVAVILFEGGMNLDLRRLRRERVAIRRLVTVGALFTGVGGTLAARLVLGWTWPLAVLFGALVIVTGPTVVTPLLRRIKVKSSVRTVLEAEGVLIDPIGAIIAVVVFELIFEGGAGVPGKLGTAMLTLGLGGLVGLAGGVLLALALRPRRLVPQGLENVLALGVVMALFQTSNALRAESGLAAVTVAGMAVGNIRTRATEDVLAFKEQLTVLLVGLLFVLLAADVRVGDMIALGWGGVAVVAVLMLVVRPLEVALCTAGSSLSRRERAFIAWLAPRGIVAAAVTSLFAEWMDARGVAGGTELRALVFLVIGATVVVYGLSGGTVARLLGVRRPSQHGFVILGANPLGLLLGRLLREGHPEIVFVDANPDYIRAARDAGFRTLFGQALDPRLIARAELDLRIGCLGLTPNEEVNLLWASRVRAEAAEPDVYVALRHGTRSVRRTNVHEAGASVLFGRGQALAAWAQRLGQGTEVTVEQWRLTRAPGPGDEEPHLTDDPAILGNLLVLTLRRGDRVRPVDEQVRFSAGDAADLALTRERGAEIRAWLRARGWQPAEAPAPEAAPAV